MPQINLDAPRLLAHCFLYELDSFLKSKGDLDFVRYMDDIDLGVDTIVDAKKALKDMDLVLHTKQVRLNSGKTLILTNEEAKHHFRIQENADLDFLRDSIDDDIAQSNSLIDKRRIIRKAVSKGLIENSFNGGNGEKILKRWIGLANKVHAKISSGSLEKIILYWPNVRELAFAHIRIKYLTNSRAKMLLNCLSSGLLVDDAAIADMSNNLVETLIRGSSCHALIGKIISKFRYDSYYNVYCRLWLESKTHQLQNYCLLYKIRKMSGLRTID